MRYVARDRVASLKEAIAGYQQYLKLTQAYADEIIRRTRQAQPASAPPTDKIQEKHENPRKIGNLDASALGLKYWKLEDFCVIWLICYLVNLLTS